MPTNETKMQISEDRYNVPEKDYAQMADDMLTYGEWNGKTLGDFSDWAFRKSHQYCADMERLQIIAMAKGSNKTEMDEIGDRLFDLVVDYIKEMDK